MENIESEQKLPMTEEEKKMYNKAKRRVSFKVHFMIYFLCIALFWLLWVFLFKDSVNQGETSVFFRLTLALTLFWGIFVFAHYLIVYKWNKSYIEKEIKRLKKQQAKQQEELEQLKQQQEEE